MFVRQDLSIPDQAVQSLHAIYHMGQCYHPENGIPNVVYIGVPNIQSLEKALKKLKENQIPHYCWFEPDNDLGFTAIATVPISGEMRQVLKNYRLWSHAGGRGSLTKSHYVEKSITPAPIPS